MSMDYDDFLETAFTGKKPKNAIVAAMWLIELRKWKNHNCAYCGENLASEDDELWDLVYSKIKHEPVHPHCKQQFEYGKDNE